MGILGHNLNKHAKSEKTTSESLKVSMRRILRIFYRYIYNIPFVNIRYSFKYLISYNGDDM
jgi:hypothetical protein